MTEAMSAVNQHVFSHGMRDTRETFDAWSERPWVVLRGWLALSVAIALALLAGDLVRRRAAHAGPHADPPAGADRTVGARRPAADPLAQLAGPRPARRPPASPASSPAPRCRSPPPSAPASRAGSTSRRASWRSSSSARSPSSRSAPRRSTSASRARPSPPSSTSPALQLILSVLPHALLELTALFLPLAAWLIASRRGEWNQLLAATLVTVADRDPGPGRRRDDRGLRLAPHPRSPLARSIRHHITTHFGRSAHKIAAR